MVNLSSTILLVLVASTAAEDSCPAGKETCDKQTIVHNLNDEVAFVQSQLRLHKARTPVIQIKKIRVEAAVWSNMKSVFKKEKILWTDKLVASLVSPDGTVIDREVTKEALTGRFSFTPFEAEKNQWVLHDQPKQNTLYLRAPDCKIPTGNFNDKPEPCQNYMPSVYLEGSRGLTSEAAMNNFNGKPHGPILKDTKASDSLAATIPDDTPTVTIVFQMAGFPNPDTVFPKAKCHDRYLQPVVVA